MDWWIDGMVDRPESGLMEPVRHAPAAVRFADNFEPQNLEKQKTKC